MAEGKVDLKKSNFKWLCTVVTFDIFVLAFLIYPDALNNAGISNIAIAKSIISIFLPVIPLLLTNIFPEKLKYRLVFWRWNNPLPGSRAFTELIKKDERIDVAKLRRNVGAFPTDPKEQNSFWYGLYTKIKNDVSVLDAHKSFLLYRDICSLSVILLCFTAAAIYVLDFPIVSFYFAASLFLIQYLLTMLSARFSGERLVCTVLSIHSTRKIANPV